MVDEVSTLVCFCFLQENYSRASIAVQQGLRLYKLLSVLATFAFERLVGLTVRVLIEEKEFTK